MVKLKEKNWYYSKRGHLCRIDEILDSGDVRVTVHYTGSHVIVPKEQANYFTDAPEPDIEPGTYANSEDVCCIDNQYSNIYNKYPHIIKGSIYIVKSTTKSSEKIIKIDGKMRVKKNKLPKGSTRCKIKCCTQKCSNERDIKVQDAFQVKYCMDCKRKINKENLKKFLKKRKQNEKRKAL